ncbi:dCTP pyrophosphatase 1 [Galendromus occidentalis]|uniref:dCTP pyrophosphatase 1 n=1 Tax=Galendromus occidentalis TaxID=34638 RepID=A0AAJ6QZ39_9ACAR|nr:dCTP pyrophosphatase 1 [Galendromus occidentalis]
MSSEGNEEPTSAASPGTTFSDLSLEKLRQTVEKFCVERDWQQYHTPRNLMLALVGEVGELAEIFQWREVSPNAPELSPREKIHLGEELSDVLLYLIRLADRCGVDLSAAVLRKIEKNAEKYPVDRVYGKAKKYKEYEENEGPSHENS